MSILINPITKLRLDLAKSNGHQAILISGPKGSGKEFLAITYLNELGLKNNQILQLGVRTKPSIGIDDIRTIQQFLNIKTIGNNPIKRAIVITDAENLTIEAQNALLKSTEELPNDTIFIMTISAQTRILVTLKSRFTEIAILPVELKTLNTYAKQHTISDKEVIQRSYLLGEGYPGLCIQLLKNNETNGDDEFFNQINTAKEYLAYDPLEKYKYLSSINNDAIKMTNFAEALKKISYYGIVNSKNSNSLNTWINIYLTSSNAVLNLSKNVSPKLISLELSF